MFYKNWPYWLKGGIFGVILGIASYTYLSLTHEAGFMRYFSDMNGVFHFQYMIPPFIIYFVGGAIIGSIYGFIRHIIKK